MAARLDGIGNRREPFGALMLDYFTSEEEPRWTRWLLLLFIPLGALYLIGAKGNSETFNTSRDAMYANDQKVYLRLAQDLKQSGWSLVTPRHRTPGYPYVISPFFSDDLAVEDGSKDPVSLAWFERARTVSIGLSVVCLIALYFFFRRVFPLVESSLLVASIACLLYVFRAGYTQPELLYWTLNLVLFFLLMRMLLLPSWRLAAVAGALSAPTFLVKAGTQPLLLLFVVSFGLKLLWDRFAAGTSWRETGVRLAQGALVPVLFIVCLLPYLINSNRVYGEPFYSIYSKYLMWTLPEVEKNDKLYVDKLKTWAVQNAGAGAGVISVDDYRAKLKILKRKAGQPYVEPDGLPSLGRYFEKQSFAEIVARPKQGIRSTWKRMEKYYPSSWQFLKTVLWIALALALISWRWSLQGLKRHGYVAFYAVGFFVGYLILYGWYDALRIGPRLMLGLYTPALLLGMLVIYLAGRELSLKGVRLGRVVNLALLVLLSVTAVKILGDKNSDVSEERSELYRYFSGN